MEFTLGGRGVSPPPFFFVPFRSAHVTSYLVIDKDNLLKGFFTSAQFLSPSRLLLLVG